MTDTPSTPHERAVEAAAARALYSLRAARAIIAAYLSEMQAAGIKQVSREPTEAILVAPSAAGILLNDYELSTDDVRAIWSAMWDAAPPVQGGEE